MAIDSVEELEEALDHGQVNGSFVRTGDDDHRMSLYELDRFRENQQRNAFHDVAIVDGATLAHLDSALSRAGFGERE